MHWHQDVWARFWNNLVIMESIGVKSGLLCLTGTTPTYFYSFTLPNPCSVLARPDERDTWPYHYLPLYDGQQVFAPVPFFLFFLGGGEWRLNSHILILLFRQESVHSGSVSWDDCGRVFPGELHMSSFPDRFPHYAWKMAQSAQSDFPGSRVYEFLGVTCHLHFWQNDWDLLCANTLPVGVS